ncbi:MAG: hydroxyacid dehydrogenase [Burkholderiales bacterium]|nr:hydroxyacid dehydrogenase [Burkholderiales bacterium]
MPRILLTHTPAALERYYGARALAALEALAEVRRNPLAREWTEDELVEAARGCDLVISYRQTAAGAGLLARLTDIVAFARCAIDIRNIDVAAAGAAGILVTQASAGFVTAVSEWVIGAMIDLSRAISASSEAYHAGRVPAAPMGRELRGATLGVVGYGQIGRALCTLARAFGMRVLVSDPFVTVADAGIAQVAQDTLLADADYVVCLAVATDATENLFDDAAFARMKPGAFFINPSRGNLVDEAALARALDGGRLAGCAMDVGRAPDQMPTPALARHPKVIATPHLGGLTPPAIEHQALETVAQAQEILAGRAPQGAVNAAQATRLARLRRH